MHHKFTVKEPTLTKETAPKKESHDKENLQERITPEDREFMKLAIEEAKRSSAEDSRPHPRVGVVVALDGKILAKSHRGESEPGRHAEFVALERYLGDQTITGATIYTTLEPCTRRNPPKIGCVKRIIERKVGKVWIGMLDPNPEIQGNGRQALRDAGIPVEMFASDLIDQIEEINRDFKRSFPAALSPDRSSERPQPAPEGSAAQGMRDSQLDGVTPAYETEEKQALRAYLQRAEVRLSTMHRIAGAFLSGAGLLILLPVFLKDALFTIIHTLADNTPVLQGLLLNARFYQTLISIPFVIALVIPLWALWLLLEDLTLFYFSANIPRFAQPTGPVFHPRFALTAIPYADNDSAGTKKRIREVQFGTDMSKFVVPFHEDEKAWLEEMANSPEGKSIALRADNWVEPFKDYEDYDALRMAFGLAGAYNRPLLEEAAKAELSLIRHNLRLRRLVMRYMKAFILIVWTALITYGMVAFIGLVKTYKDGRDTGDLVVIALSLLLWSSIAPYLIRAPVKWLYNEYSQDAKEEVRDQHLVRFERRTIVACLIASVFAAVATLLLAGGNWWPTMGGPVIALIAFARSIGRLRHRALRWI